MHDRFGQMWNEEDGVLSFEWVVLVTLLVLGIVAGLAAARDAVIDELGDVAEAVLAFDQSFSLEGVPELGIPPAEYSDTAETVARSRATGPIGQ